MHTTHWVNTHYKNFAESAKIREKISKIFNVAFLRIFERIEKKSGAHIYFNEIFLMSVIYSLLSPHLPKIIS